MPLYQRTSERQVTWQTRQTSSISLMGYAYVKLTKQGPMENCSPWATSTPSLGMFIQVPDSLPKSITLKLLKPSYLSCACLEANPTPSICKVSPYNLTSPEPNTSPSGWVVMKRNLFLYSPSMHFSTYFRGSSAISVMLALMWEVSKFSFVIASILYFTTFWAAFALGSFLELDLATIFLAPVLPCLLPLVLVCFIFGQDNNNIQHMATVENKDLCELPKKLQFDFHEGQEMHTTLTLVNRFESIISYKIKTNKQGLYLVKPMEGNIYNKDTVKVSFRRKEMSVESFQALLKNPSINKEKFLVEFNCKTQDNIGRSIQYQQVSYLSVSFVDHNQKEHTSPAIVESVGEEESHKLEEQIEQGKSQLQRLILEKQCLMGARTEGKRTQRLTMTDIVLLLVLSFSIGIIF